jgi:hypothetical protein
VYFGEFGRELKARRLRVTFDLQCRPDALDLDLLLWLKEAGLVHIYVGVESVVPRQLKLYNKGMNRDKIDPAMRILEAAGLRYTVFLVPFDPLVRREEVLANLRFVEEHRKDSRHRFHWLTEIVPVPGTKIRSVLECLSLIDPPGQAIPQTDEVMDLSRMNVETRALYRLQRKVKSGLRNAHQELETIWPGCRESEAKKLFLTTEVSAMVESAYFDTLKEAVEKLDPLVPGTAEALILRNQKAVSAFLIDLRNRLPEASPEDRCEFRLGSRSIVYHEPTLVRKLGQEMMHILGRYRHKTTGAAVGR